MAKRVFHPVEIGPNHFTYQNDIDIQLSCRGRLFDVPASYTVFFEDAGEFPTVVVTSEDVEGTYHHFEIAQRIERTGAAGRVVIDRAEEIAKARHKALTEIDRSAEETRGYFITLGSGQAMVYQQKRDEAEMVVADPEISSSLVPHIAQEAVLNQISLFDQAVVVLTMAQMWQTVSAVIETRRLAAKADVNLATKLDQIEAAKIIDWSDLVPA